MAEARAKDDIVGAAKLLLDLTLLARLNPMEDAGVVPAVVGDISERSVDVAPTLKVRNREETEFVEAGGTGRARAGARSGFMGLIPWREELEALRAISRGVPPELGGAGVGWAVLLPALDIGLGKGAGV